MRDSAERDLAVANELGHMADARIKELEQTCADLRQVVRMCLQQFEFQYGKRGRGWDAKFLMERLAAVIAESEGSGPCAASPATDAAPAIEAAKEIVPTCLSRTCFIKDCSYDDCWGCDGAAKERERVAAIISKHLARAAVVPEGEQDRPVIDVAQQHDFIQIKGSDSCGLRGCTLGILEHAWIPPVSAVFDAATQTEDKEQ